MLNTGAQSDPVNVLQCLVETPSVSGCESACANLFAHCAESLGFAVEIDDVGNVIAIRGGSDPTDRDIVMLGHIDTVPGAIPVRVENGILHGRGAVDAKGPLVAMLLAAAVAQIQPGTRLIVIAAVGEEAPDSIGARAIVNRFHPAACIIGEPSGIDGVTLGYKGRLLAELTTRTVCAHSAADRLSAADMAVDWWNRIRSNADTLNLAHANVFDHIQATIHDIQSSSDSRTENCNARIGFRLPTWITPSELTRFIQDTAPDAGALRTCGAEFAFVTDRNDPVVRSLSAAIRKHGLIPRPKRKSGTSDMNVVAPIWQCPIAAYGPGDSSLDHTPHEHINLTEFERSIHVLSTALSLLIEEFAAAPSRS